MALATFGTLDLEIIPLEALSFEEEWTYGEHPVIEGKPVLQFTGEALRKAEIAVRLHHTFTDPAQDLEALRALARTHEAQVLQYADGTVEGRFVLTRIQHQVLETTPTGEPLHVTAHLSLTEHAGNEAAATARLPVSTATQTTTAPTPAVGNAPDGVSLNSVVRSGS